MITLAIQTNEKCERCGGQIIKWQIGTSNYAENHTYFYLCKKCSRELDETEISHPNEKGGIVGLCTKMNIRFACWVKTGRIMPYDEAVTLLQDSLAYDRTLKELWAL